MDMREQIWMEMLREEGNKGFQWSGPERDFRTVDHVSGAQATFSMVRPFREINHAHLFPTSVLIVRSPAPLVIASSMHSAIDVRVTRNSTPFIRIFVELVQDACGLYPHMLHTIRTRLVISTFLHLATENPNI
jgi:hypothetical protein